MLLAASLLAVAVVAGLAVWEMRPKPLAGKGSTSRSDYILENFELTSLDQDGKESFSVKAPRLERDPGGKSLTITLPEFSFPDKKEGRWLVTSKQRLGRRERRRSAADRQRRDAGPALAPWRPHPLQHGAPADLPEQEPRPER